MKRALRGRRFGTLQQLGTAIYKWRSELPNDWFASGLSKLHERWQRSVLREGDYVDLPGDDD